MSAMNMNQRTHVLPASTSSSSVTITHNSPQALNCIITNEGTASACVVTGISSATAVYPTASSSQPGTVILAGQTILVTKNLGDTVMAAITSSGTATLYIQPGPGE